MLSLGGVVGSNKWLSVFIMCVWGSWHDRAPGHWHSNSVAITPAVLRSDWCSYMGHRRLQRSHRYRWKVGFCSFLSLSPSVRLLKKREKEGSTKQCPRPMFSLYVSCSFPPSPSYSCLPFHDCLIPLRLVSKLSFSLSAWLNHFLFISPNILSTSKKTLQMHFRNSFLSPFFKGSLLRTNTVQTQLPSVLSPFESLCSLNTICLKRMPSAFLFFYTAPHARSRFLAVTHIHKHSLAITHACTNAHIHSHTDLQQKHTHVLYAHLGDQILATSLVWSVDFSSTFKPHFISLHPLRLQLYACPHSSYWPFSSKGLIQVKLLICIFYMWQLSILVVALNKAVKWLVCSN